MLSVRGMSTHGEVLHQYTPAEYHNQLQWHPYMTGMDIRYIYPENIPVAFFSIVREVCGQDVLNELSSVWKQPLVYSLDMQVSASENIKRLSEAMTKDFRNEECNRAIQKICAQLKGIAHPTIDVFWEYLWKSLDVLFAGYDIMNIISLTICIDCVLHYVFAFNKPNELDYFIMARLLENFALYLQNIPVYKKLTPFYEGLGRRLAFLRNARREGFNPPPDLAHEDIEHLAHFVMHGVFKPFSNQPRSVLPFSANPEDGLILRAVLSVYLMSHMVDSTLQRKLLRFLPTAYKQLTVEYLNLIKMMRSGNIEPGKVLDLRTVEAVYRDFDNQLQKMFDIFKQDILTECIQYIMKTHVQPMMSKHNV